MPLTPRNRHDHVSKLERTKCYTFEEKTGVAYTEVVARAAPMRADWVWKTRGSTAGISLFRFPGPGCSTLRNMALRKACQNVVNLVPESLEGLEWPIGEQLWKTILAYELDSLYAWRIFVAVYPHEMNAQLQRRCQSILEPNMTLQEYVKPITSRSCQWITFLSLSHLTCSRSDLINISKLTNIGILTIGRGVEASANGLDDSIDNSIFRAWSRAAKETGAFSRLRVLVCRSQRDITFQALDYLSQIPTLTHFLLEHCPLGPKDILFAQKLGWKYRAGTGLIGFLAESGTTKRSWDETMHACWREAVGSVNITGESLPILHLAIGSPLDDVVVDVTGKPILRCFYRDVATARVPAKSVVPPRRPLADPFPPQSVPKRIMKVRNQQSLGSALSEFWV